MEIDEKSQVLREILENVSHYETQGCKHIKAKDYQSAQSLYQSALPHSQNPRVVGTLLSLRGLCKSSQGSHSSALIDYCLALQSDPLDACTLIRQGVSLMNLGRYDAACDSFRQGLVLQPDNRTISELLEQLDCRISEMKESEGNVKYPLKRKISEIIDNREVQDQDLFLNFSNLREIDRRASSASNRGVLFRFKEDVIEVERTEGSQVKNPQLSREEIAEIQKHESLELDPEILHRQLQTQYQAQLLSTSFLSSSNPRKQRKSILRQSNPNLPLPLPLPLPSHLPTKPTKRLSALSVKNIDGKVLTSSNNLDMCSDKRINFGFVLEDENSVRLYDNLTKSHNDVRKSSLRLSGSILERKTESIKFMRKDSGFSRKLNIDGKVFERNRENSSGSSRSRSRSSEKEIATSSFEVIKKNGPKLVRKQSILRKVGTPLLKEKHNVMFCEEEKRWNELQKQDDEEETKKKGQEQQ